MGRTSYTSKVASTAKIKALYASPTAITVSATGQPAYSFYTGFNGSVNSPDGNWYIPLDGPGGSGTTTAVHHSAIINASTGALTYKAQATNYTAVSSPLYAQYDTFSNKPYSVCTIGATGIGLAVDLSSTDNIAYTNGTTPATNINGILYNQTLKHAFIGLGTQIMFVSGTALNAYGATSGGTTSSTIAGFGATSQKSFCFSSTTCDTAGGILESTTGSVWTASTPFPAGVIKGWCGEEIDGKFYVLTNKGIVTSTDHGVTWTLCSEVVDTDLMRIFKIPSGLYALGVYLWKSTDNGVSWSKVGSSAINAKRNAIYISSLDMFAFGGSFVNTSGGLAFAIPSISNNAAVATPYTNAHVISSAVLSASGDKAHVYFIGAGTSNTAYTTQMITTISDAPIFKSNPGSTYQISCVGGGASAAPYAPGIMSCFGGVVIASGSPGNTMGYMSGSAAKTADVAPSAITPGPTINGNMYGAGGAPQRVDTHSGGGSGFIAATSAVLSGSYFILVGLGGGPAPKGQGGAVYVEEM